MKKICVICGLLLAIGSVFAQPMDTLSVRQAILQMMESYPQANLQDIYKSFYQDRFGPGHIISDTASVRRYLMQELSEQDLSFPVYYEPTGSEGRYVRVFLAAVADGMVPAELLLDAFVRSANSIQDIEIEWVDEWENILRIIKANKIEINGFDADAPGLSEAAKDNRAAHHSRAYNAAYHPHYRIVERSIFEKEIKPLIDGGRH